MLDFLRVNFGTIVVSLILIAAVALAVRSMVRAHKKGESFACGGDCAHCGHCDPIRDAAQFEQFKKMQQLNQTKND